MAAPIDEGDFRNLANVMDGISNAVVNVLYPIEFLIHVQGICAAPIDSIPALFLKWICSTCRLCEDMGAIDMAQVNVHTGLDGLSSLITLDVRTESGRDRASRFFCNLCTRMEPFDPNQNTQFALLVFGNHHPIVNLISRRLVKMGAKEILQARFIDVPNVEAEVTAVTQWREDLEAALHTLWHTLAVPQQVFVSQSENPQEVFQIYSSDEFAPIELSSNGVVTGHLFQGFVLRRYGNIFLVPSEDDVEIVAIKRIHIASVNFLLGRGHQENPWRNIYRLQMLGDDVHVPRLIQGRAMSDGHYLYQITTWRNQGSLDQFITGPLPLPAAREYYLQMLQLLRYIHEHGICHHDVKLGNFLVDNGRLLLNDFAMSFVIPPGGMVHHDVPFGTPALMLPDHYRRDDYDAEQYDLWGCTCSFFTLLTGIPYVYEVPTEENILFAYVIQAGLLSTHVDTDGLYLIEDRVMARIQEALQLFDWDTLLTWQRTLSRLFHYRDRVSQLPHDVLELFENTLTLDPPSRWTVTQAFAWIGFGVVD